MRASRMGLLVSVQATNEADVKTAIAEIEKFADFVTYEKMDAISHTSYEAMLAKAKLGDLAPMASDFETNCTNRDRRVKEER